MPVLIVYGMSSDASGYGKLINNLQSVTANALRDIHPYDVSVFFPVDIVEAGLGEELICIIEGLFEKPERTAEVRKELARAILKVLYRFSEDCLPDCIKIEVIVKRFNQDVDGFAVWDGKA
jgi:hypothetical protein